MKRDDRQLELFTLDPKPTPKPAPKLKVIHGLGQRQQESLASRDAVARVLVEAGADLLLRRISADRAEVIEQAVEEILQLFDRVDAQPVLLPVLQRKLDELEALMRDTRATRRTRARR